MTNNPDQENVILLLTRPLGGNERFCLKIKHLLYSCEILDNPIQRIDFLPSLSKVNKNSVLIFTSANGLRAAKKHNLINKKCFVVGANTKKIAVSFGYDVLGFSKDQENLLKLIKSKKPTESMVHIRGKHTVGNLCDALKRNQFSCLDIIGYNQEPLKIKKQNLQKIHSGRPVILPIFSSRSAELLQSNLDLTGFNVIAISEAVAKIVTGVELGELVISKKPDLNSMQEATLAILRRLIKFDGSTS
jgi:uroporphyrinogen-III synthase|tara:strand:+ start:150 stop:887 length:738 start_codon:yes stop_codon:yes gene_type:complete